jgi:prepilin-type N-terminal cleavage/methylation domain-containing protein
MDDRATQPPDRINRRWFPVRKRKLSGGFSLVELVIVMSIVAFISATIVWPFYMSYTGRRNVQGGIMRLLAIKKGIERVSLECAGKPYRTTGNGIDELQRIWDPKGAKGAMPMWPKVTATCDSAGLRDFVATDVGIGYPPHPACSMGAGLQDCMDSTARPAGLNSMFVATSVAPCNFGGQASNPGWDYNFAEVVGGLPDGTRAQPGGVQIFCASMAGSRGTIVTVVINGPGYGSGPKPIDDGAGVIGPDGNYLTNYCPCGPWCQETDMNGAIKRQGCCRGCTYTTAGSGINAGSGAPALGYGN